MVHDVDVLIIGAGPAGATAGAWLAQRGHRVVALERAIFPRWVIGESLLPRCNDLLAEAGLLEAVQARNFQVKEGAAFLHGDEYRRFCFADVFEGEQPSTFQVPRHDFDQTLATAARGHGVDIRFGCEVQAVEAGPPHTITARDLETEETFTYRARYLLDCSGYGRVLARMWQLDAPSPLPPRTAICTMIEGDRRPEGAEAGDIVIAIHEGKWIWMIPFSNGRTSIGVVGNDLDSLGPNDRSRLFAAVRGEPYAAKRLAKAVPVQPTRRLSAWSTKVNRLYGPGWALAGNAADFLDPVFSSGVCLALESAVASAARVHQELTEGSADWESYVSMIEQATSVFREFVTGWYRGDLARIFFAKHHSASITQSITSVLAGYVLNKRNSLVRNPEGGLAALLRAV